MSIGTTIVVTAGDYRAKVYREGGLCYEQNVPGIGWVLADDDGPDDEFERIVWAARRQAFPHLADITN